MRRVSCLARQLSMPSPAVVLAVRRITAPAIVVDTFGPPEVMKLAPEAALRPVADGEVVVRIHAAGVNPSDTYMRLGPHGPWAATPHLLPKPPFTPGKDGAGVVEEVGPGVSGVSVGDRVYTTGSVTGTYATRAICQAGQVHPLPQNASFAQGACVGVPCATAYHALKYRARVQPGQSVFIHGASGAVGLAAVQLALQMGATVTGTAGTPQGREAVVKAGAAAVLNHRDGAYLDELLEKKKAGAFAGFDVVLEMAAHANLPKDLTITAKRGCVCIIGSKAEPVPVNPRLTMVPEIDVRGVFLGTQTAEEKAATHKALQDAMAAGTLSPVVGMELPLSDAPKAHAEVMAPSSGGAVGNIVLIP